jgi:glycosyltransferase involved in cell wall biosynthesis
MLIAAVPFFRLSGTPINVLYMCRALTELGFEVHILTLPGGQTIGMPGLVYHLLPRLPLVGVVPIGFSLAKVVYNIILLLAVVRLLLRRRFCAVHAIEEAAFLAMPVARMFGVPGVMDLDSDICHQLASYPSKLIQALAVPAAFMRRVALRRSNCAVVVSRSLSDMARSINPTISVFEIKDIPPEECLRPADPKMMDQLRREFDFGTGRIVAYTGNFDRRQGIEILLHALPLVLRRCPDVTLLLVGGEDQEIEHLSGLARSLQIEDHVRFAGKRPIEIIPEILTLSDVLVSPRQEPLVTPLKIYAYMASGRPIVATDLPTHREVLSEDVAFLTPPTLEGLASGIIQGLEDKTEAGRRAQNAKHLVSTCHTFERFKRQVGEVYASIVPSDRVCVGVEPLGVNLPKDPNEAAR